AIVIVRANTADIADAWIAFPTTKNASSSTLPESPQVGEEEDLEDRPDQHRRDVHRRPDPVEQAPVGEHAADEEDAQKRARTARRSHVSESVTCRRAAVSKGPRQTGPPARQGRARPVATPMSGPGAPPRLAPG